MYFFGAICNKFYNLILNLLFEDFQELAYLKWNLIEIWWWYFLYISQNVYMNLLGFLVNAVQNV
jgi:hypothetical protein